MNENDRRAQEARLQREQANAAYAAAQRRSAQEQQDRNNREEANRLERDRINAHNEAMRKQAQERAWPSQGTEKKTGPCFVATAAFGDYNAPEVVYLSAFRDESLSRSVLGRGFIRAYYSISPQFARVISRSVFLRSAVRNLFLQPMIFLLRRIRH